MTLLVFLLAALLEIAGCFAMWTWWRLGGSPLWLVPGLVALAGFAWLLSLSDAAQAGRAFAAYGGVYVAAAIGWLWLVEGVRPDRWDLAGGALCLAGCAVVLWGPR